MDITFLVKQLGSGRVNCISRMDYLLLLSDAVIQECMLQVKTN